MIISKKYTSKAKKQGLSFNLPTQAGIYDSQPTFPTVFANPINACEYIVNITDDIDQPFVYDQIVALLLSATEHDTIVWNINSEGGYVKTLNMLVGYKEMCSAQQVHILMGDAASAATVFYLSKADQYIVGDRASFMIHEFQTGSGGTMSNAKRRTDFSNAECEKWVKESYLGFLTEEEMLDVLKGVEIYLDANQIRDRLAKREELRQQQAQQDSVDFMEALEAPFDYSTLSEEELNEELEDLKSEMKRIQTEIRNKRKDVTPSTKTTK